MKRFIMDDLVKWKNSKRRKPLILRGARQVGKTWALQEFGKSFQNGYAYFNFDKNPEYNQFFETTKDVKRIIKNLAMASGQRINPETLLIFDEIQSCPEALNTLKYFCEDLPEYYIASAGSLLGIKLSQGFPVGKVDFLNLGPMTFTEFLIANGDGCFAEYISEIDEISNIPDAFFNPLIEKLKMYFVVGGMPEPVLIWTQDRDAAAANKAQENILMSYENDFGKHADKNDFPKLQYIWDSLPSQLSRENKKFLYSAVKPGARAREYENALNWLYNADLIHKVFRITKPGLPMSAYDDLSSFKIYMSDTGLLRCHSKLDISAFKEKNKLFTEFKGALTENYVLESIARQFNDVPRYWKDNNYEVDFIVQRENKVIPIEVKAGTNVGASSIKRYYAKYESETPIIVRLSLKNLSLDGNILNIPLFLVDRLNELIGIAVNELGR